MTRPEQVRFSVVTPVHCASNTVVGALNSALQQTYRPHEIIVVDDGSPDDAAERVALFAAGPRPSREVPIRIIRQPNRGAAAARNVAVREAQGNWVAFLDADDLWLDSKLERQRDAILATPGCQWCLTGFRLYVDRVYSGSYIPDLRTIEKYHRYRNCFGPTSCYAVSKTVLTTIGGFREDLGTTCEDWELAIRLYRSYPLAIVSDALVEYHGSAASSSRRGLVVLEAETKIVDTLIEDLKGVRRWATRRLVMASLLARAARNVPGDNLARLRLALHSLLYWPFPSVAGPRARAVLCAIRDGTKGIGLMKRRPL